MPLLACLPLCAATAMALEGIWKGHIRRRAVYETQYHRAVYEEELDLTLRVQGHSVTGQGTAYLTDPVITRVRNDKLYAEWKASYQPAEFEVSINGNRSGQGPRDVISLAVTPKRRVKVRFLYRDGEGAKIEDWLELPHLAVARIPENPRVIGDFSSNDPLSVSEKAILPPDLVHFGEALLEGDVRTTGSFQEIKPPARRLSTEATLALFLSYFVLIIPGLIAAPASVACLSVLGTLLGSLPALQSLGLGWTAHILQGCGWSVAGLVLILESSRILQAGQSAGEKSWKTTADILVSVILDSLALAGTFSMMGVILRFIVASSARVGPTAATSAGLAGALLTTYAVGLTMHAAKRRVLRFGDR